MTHLHWAPGCVGGLDEVVRCLDLVLLHSNPFLGCTSANANANAGTMTAEWRTPFVALAPAHAAAPQADANANAATLTAEWRASFGALAPAHAAAPQADALCCAGEMGVWHSGLQMLLP